MKYSLAPEIKKEIEFLVKNLKLTHIKLERIHCIRSFDVKTRAYARIWGMPKIFKEIAGIQPHYIIEVNARRFDKLPRREQIKTLIHELLHIPKTFSGALVSHKGRYHRIDEEGIEKLLKNLK